MGKKSRLLSESVTDLNHKLSNNTDWTTKEINIMNKNYNVVSMSEIMKLLPNRTKKAIWQMARILGMTKKTPDWKTDDIKILKQYFGKEPFSETRQRFKNRTITSIKIEASRLKIIGSKPRWTDNEIEILKKNYNGNCVKIAHFFENRSIPSIRLKVKELNLKKNLKKHNDS
jgi:hypothetical protein